MNHEPMEMGAMTPRDMGVDPRPDMTTRPEEMGVIVPPVMYDGLVINEVAAAGEFEDWFELTNISNREIDLTGCTFTDDIERPARAMFPAGTKLSPGQFISFEVSDQSVGFKLGSEELVAIYSPDGELIDQVAWADGESPRGRLYGRYPDGTGPLATLETPTRDQPNSRALGQGPVEPMPRCGDGVRQGQEECDVNDFAGASCESRGFLPGSALVCRVDCTIDDGGCERPMAMVVINEVTSSGDDEIELYNMGTADADLSGWFVTDDGYPDDPNKRYVFDPGTVLKANEFMVLVKGIDHDFGIGREDEIKLYNMNDDLIDHVVFGRDEAATSFCRIPDGSGEPRACSVATFGGANMP
jgi:hypothetical protein